ncbi:MAG TPA: MBOAT family O-acyltransferase [Vicinamibacterales bacterium]|nr:MBOAT family O-acyltransferase [Vicinamibacterales bacterium]
MVFNSIQFAVFFAVVYCLYRVLPHRLQNVMLLVASYMFYSAWDWRFLGLLIGSTVIDFQVARYIADQPDRGKRRLALLVSLIYNLGVLASFKYFNFFGDGLRRMFGLAGLELDPITIHVILPMGISFYTFMTISYVVDVYRDEIPPETKLLDFALFVAYFPHLVAGPILRASKLLPQITHPRVLTRAQTREGLWLFGWGLFQKMFVADNLAGIVSDVYRPGADVTGADVLLATYAFAFQIYGDFAGYSNMARGISKLLGIELNVNFRFPYFVASPQEFWRHWHISLSTWLRDYLYIPLGGSRGSATRTHRNLLITMVLGGLWHGAAWTFVLWGAFQGVALVIGRVIAGWGSRRGIVIPDGLNWKRAVLALVMFHVTCYGWLIFRAESAAHVVDLTRRVAVGVRPTAHTLNFVLAPLALVVMPLMVVHVYQAIKDTESAPLRLTSPLRYGLYGAVFYLVLLFGNFEGAQFIYFQF